MSPTARRYLTALIFLAALGGGAEVIRVSRVAPTLYRPDFAAVPMRIGEYEGRDLPIEESIYNYLSPDGMLERQYEGPGAPARLSLIYSGDWRSIHSPAGCFPAAGWQTEEDRVIVIPGLTDERSDQTVPARLLVVEREGQRLLALFTFAYYGGATTDWPEMGLRVATGPRGAGGLVIALNTPLVPDRDRALERAATIFRAVYPRATGFWYEPDAETPAVLGARGVGPD